MEKTAIMPTALMQTEAAEGTDKPGAAEEKILLIKKALPGNGIRQKSAQGV